MAIGDRMMLAGIAAVLLLLSIALWSLRNGRPHYRWLEWLVGKRYGARQRIAIAVTALLGVVVIMIIVAAAFTVRFK